MAERLPGLRPLLPGGRLLDPRELFPRPITDLWLEIGLGSGEHLAKQATSHPDIGFIGCEPFVNGVAALLARMERERLDNIRILDDDARPLLSCLAEATLGRVFVLFPDPWPKRRHHRRRLIGQETVAELARVLREGGELRLATDDMDYAGVMLELIGGHGGFRWMARRAADWRERPEDAVITRYETKALALGRRCVYLRFERFRNVSPSPP